MDNFCGVELLRGSALAHTAFSRVSPGVPLLSNIVGQEPLRARRIPNAHVTTDCILHAYNLPGIKITSASLRPKFRSLFPLVNPLSVQVGIKYFAF